MKPNSNVPPVQLFKSSEYGPLLWVIYFRGHNESVFGCLEAMECQDSSRAFFSAIKPEESLHYQLCQENRLFSKLEWAFRYQVIKENKESEEGRDGQSDEDVPMDDVDIAELRL
jgi:hypothetical protein